MKFEYLHYTRDRSDDYRWWSKPTSLLEADLSELLILFNEVKDYLYYQATEPRSFFSVLNFHQYLAFVRLSNTPNADMNGRRIFKMEGLLSSNKHLFFELLPYMIAFFSERCISDGQSSRSKEAIITDINVDELLQHDETEVDAVKRAYYPIWSKEREILSFSTFRYHKAKTKFDFVIENGACLSSVGVDRRANEGQSVGGSPNSLAVLREDSVRVDKHSNIDATGKALRLNTETTSVTEGNPLDNSSYDYLATFQHTKDADVSGTNIPIVKNSGAIKTSVPYPQCSENILLHDGAIISSVDKRNDAQYNCGQKQDRCGEANIPCDKADASNYEYRFCTIEWQPKWIIGTLFNTGHLHAFQNDLQNPICQSDTECPNDIYNNKYRKAMAEIILGLEKEGWSKDPGMSGRFRMKINASRRSTGQL